MQHCGTCLVATDAQCGHQKTSAALSHILSSSGINFCKPVAGNSIPRFFRVPWRNLGLALGKRCDSIAENRRSASARLAPKLPESRKRHAGNERCHGNARGRAGVGSAGMVGTAGSLFQQPGVRGRGRSERSDFVQRCRGAPAPQPTGRGAVCRPRRGLSFTLTHVWLLAVPPAAQ